MTITAPITAVGIVRATELLQAARADSALRHEDGPRTVSAEIARAPAPPGADEARALPSSQRRVVDLQV